MLKKQLLKAKLFGLKLFKPIKTPYPKHIYNFNYKFTIKGF